MVLGHFYSTIVSSATTSVTTTITGPTQDGQPASRKATRNHQLLPPRRGIIGRNNETTKEVAEGGDFRRTQLDTPCSV